MLFRKKSNFTPAAPLAILQTRFRFAIALVICLVGFVSNLKAQEARLLSNVLIVGSGEGAYPGIGLGVESPVSNHFSAGIDISVGFNSYERAIVFRPQTNFYLRKDHTGFFFGPSLSYLHFRYDIEGTKGSRELYALGLSLGVKGNLSPKAKLHVSLVPQIAVGAINGAISASILQAGFSYKF